MGYQTTGAEGTVTSWAGSDNAALLSAVRAMSASVQAVGESIEVTGLGDYGMRSIPGLISWTAALEGYPLTLSSAPQIGNVGNVSFTNAGNVMIESFTLNLSADVHDITALGASPTYRTFRPGKIRWSGTLNAKLDHTLTPVLPALVGAAPLAATFTYGTTATAAGDIQITNVAPAISVGNISVVPITFVGTGKIALAGANSIFGAKTYGRFSGESGASAAADMPANSSVSGTLQPLVINLSRDGTQVLTGADAFWSSLAITCGVGAATKISIGVQGSGSILCT